MVSKISSLCETKYDDDPTEEPDDESDPLISVSTIPHRGAVNRIRVFFLSPFSLSVSTEPIASRGRLVRNGRCEHLQHRFAALPGREGLHARLRLDLLDARLASLPAHRPRLPVQRPPHGGLRAGLVALREGSARHGRLRGPDPHHVAGGGRLDDGRDALPGPRGLGGGPAVEPFGEHGVRVVLGGPHGADLGHAEPLAAQHADGAGARQRRERAELEQVGVKKRRER